MPTVQLSQLLQEVQALSEHFEDPQKYVRKLERLLEAYASRVHRQGRVKGVRPVLFSYEAPQPVLRRLELELIHQAEGRPAAALALIDALWERRSMETRQLAIRVLGAASLPAAETTRRLQDWAEENREELLVSELQTRGVGRLAADNPDELLAFASRLLAGSEVRQQSLALGALQTLLAAGGFSRLPALFGLLAPICKDPSRKLQPFLAELLGTLAEHTPKEASFFLRQLLTDEPGDGARWVARQALRRLPAEAQAELRELAK